MALPTSLDGALELPVIGSPMFIVSNPALVIAQCAGGIVGSFPALNARPKDQLDDWLHEIEEGLAAAHRSNPQAKIAPYAVNQIVHGSNDRLEHDLDVCISRRVPIIITSLRPPGDVVKAVHGYGGLVFHDVTTVRHAEKALEEGVDGLILVCAGAGGHAGSLSPFALINEVRSFYAGTVILSGAIINGSGILVARAMGADLAYMGTRFIATTEANADLRYKQMIVDSKAADVVYTPFFTGVGGNYLMPSIIASGLDPAALSEGDASRMNFGSTRVKPWKDVWGAGQGVGGVDDIPATSELISRLKREYSDALLRITGGLA